MSCPAARAYSTISSANDPVPATCSSATARKISLWRFERNRARIRPRRTNRGPPAPQIQRTWGIHMSGKTAVNRWLLVAAVAVAAAATVLLIARDHQQPTRFGVRFDPHREAKFERAGGEKEASRNGADTPAAEQVLDRAYPRTYVDDRLAIKSRDAFK